MTLLLAFLLTAALPAELRWHDVRSLRFEGKGWADTKHAFDRLPARAEGVVRAPVWNLQQDSAGMAAGFRTNATTIRARWTLRKPRLALPHMPATGVSGLDLYVRHQGKWRWIGAGRPEKTANDTPLVADLPSGTREFLLYLPLYNGVESVEIGVAEGATLEALPARGKPAVFYGTSILQGGCASRPGMAYPAIIGRELDIPTINLGFSGNGKTEPEMAKLMAELDPSVYVLDSLPNLEPAEAHERLEPFIRTLRQAHPRTPVVLVENVVYTNAYLLESRAKRMKGNNAELSTVFQKLRKEGDRHLYYVPAANLYGDDSEATVDGSHATDLGFLRMAGVIGKALRPHLR